MPDIAMCEDQDCTLKETCYRFKAIPSYYQSYADFKQEEDGTCEYHMQIYKDDKLKTNDRL